MESEKTNDAGVAPGGGPEKKPETVTGFVFAAKEAAEEGLIPKWLKPFLVWFKIERAGVKTGWKLFLILAAVVLCMGAWAMHKWDSIKFNSLKSNYATNTAFLLGRIEQDKEDKKVSDTIINSQKEGITQLTIDNNEKLRAKDVEIAKVTTERENALMRERQAFLLPDKFGQLVSNANALVSMDYDTEKYDLTINGNSISNYIVGQAYIVPLTNREIFIQASLAGQYAKPVENLTIEFWSTLDLTNIIADTNEGHWKSMIGSLNILEKQCRGMKIVSQITARPNAHFDATTFSVSTNAQESWFLGRIDIYAPGTRGVSTYPINFVNVSVAMRQANPQTPNK